MRSSTVWCTPYLVVMLHRAQSVAWRHAVGLPYTIAVPSKWLPRLALHYSHTVATCLHVL
jgi:hypothetical protein